MTDVESSAFVVLKPACSAVASNPSVETVSNLQRLLDIIPVTALQKLQSYIYFPLLLHLKNNALGNGVKQQLIDCITRLLEKTKILSVMQLFEIYVSVFLQLFDATKPSLLAVVAEEMKLSVVQCASQSLQSASREVLDEVYQTKYVPRLGQGIYICMELLKGERMKALRLAVIKCIMVHCQVENTDFFKTNNLKFRHKVADIVSLILPGILAGLLKVITGDPKVGHQIMQMAVRAWGRIIVLVFEDRTGADEPVMMNWHMNSREEEAENDYQLKSNEELQQILSCPEERYRWALSTGKKVAQHIELAVRVQSNDDWRVRLELVHVSHLILLHCARTLSSSQLPLMEVLVMLMEDSVDEVAAASSTALSELTQLPQLTSTLEENLYKVTVSLPRMIRTAGEKEQLSAVRLLTGHLRLLGSKLPQVLCSHVHLEKLVLALVQAFQLNTAGISLLETGSSQGMKDMETKIFGIGTPWKQYEYFSDEQLLDSLECACSLLGHFSDLETLIHYFVDMFDERPDYRKELILILNQILYANLKMCSEDNVALARTVINVYIDPDLWSLPLSVDADVTLNQARSNIVQACLLVEGIGKIAAALEHKFQKLLLKTLYVVLERCGSSHLVLQATGIEAAQRIAGACGYQDVTELVRANQDYVSFHVSRKLLCVQANSGVLDVLSVALAHSDKEMLPHLQGIIQEVLLLNVGTWRDKRTTPFLRVFHASMQALRRWSEYQDRQTKETGKPDSSIIESILEYHRNHTKALTFMEESEEIDNNAPETNAIEEETEVDKKESPPPPLILLAEQILQRCLHYLPSKERTQSLIVLETLNEGVKVLEPYTDQLLPVVHQIWSPLVGRLTKCSDVVVMRKSFELLCTLASAARDFIRSRTHKDVIPRICSFLSKSCASNRHSSIAYTFTQEFKLQKELLDGLGSLAVSLELMEREMDIILSVVLPYLSKEQPQTLQMSCIQLLKQLSRFDPDAVWLRLNGLLTSSKCFLCIKLKNIHIPIPPLRMVSSGDVRGWYCEKPDAHHFPHAKICGG